MTMRRQTMPSNRRFPHRSGAAIEPRNRGGGSRVWGSRSVRIAFTRHILALRHTQQGGQLGAGVQPDRGRPPGSPLPRIRLHRAPKPLSSQAHAVPSHTSTVPPCDLRLVAPVAKSWASYKIAASRIPGIRWPALFDTDRLWTVFAHGPYRLKWIWTLTTAPTTLASGGGSEVGMTGSVHLFQRDLRAGSSDSRCNAALTEPVSILR
jgi:hypothetical protein